MSGTRSINELCDAIRSKNPRRVLACLNSVIDLNQQDRYGFTPLTSACKLAKGEGAVEVLLMRGASAELKDGLGNTPICLAADWCNATSLKLLIDNKADLNVESKEKNRTPLMLAAYSSSNATVQSRLKCVELLLEHRAGTKLTDADGKTALDLLWQYSRMTYAETDVSSISEMLKAAMKKEEKEKNAVDEKDEKDEKDESSPSHQSPKPF